MSKIIESKKYVMADVANNNNKVWQYNVYENGEVLVEWGRVGKTLQSKSFSGGTSFAQSKAQEKLNKGYREVTTVDSGSTVTTVVNKNSLKTIAQKQIKSDCPQTQKLIDYLTEVNAHNIFNATQGKITYDDTSGLFKTPIGLVTQDNIVKARSILPTIKDCVSKRDYTSRKMIEAVQDYLMLVPQDIGMKFNIQKFLPDNNAILKQNDILDGLESSYASLLTAKPAAKDDKDDEPKIFNVKLTMVDESDPTFSRLKKKFHSTKKGNHISVNLDVHKIYEVEINTVKQAFDIVGKRVGNIHEFFHGTKCSNLLSILKCGLIIPPANAAYCTGRLYGNGVYAAPSSTKALNYATSFWGGRDEKRYFMFIVNMAMGKVFTPSGGYYGGYPSKGYDSTWAKGGISGVINDECIVYNTGQVNPIYLMEFR